MTHISAGDPAQINLLARRLNAMESVATNTADPLSGEAASIVASISVTGAWSISAAPRTDSQ